MTNDELEQYGNSQVGSPFRVGKDDAIRGEYKNEHAEGTVAHEAYKLGFKEQARRDAMTREVARHSNR